MSADTLVMVRVWKEQTYWMRQDEAEQMQKDGPENSVADECVQSSKECYMQILRPLKIMYAYDGETMMDHDVTGILITKTEKVVR